MFSRYRRLALAAPLAVLAAGVLPAAAPQAQPAARPTPQAAAPRPAAAPDLVTEANVSRDLMKAMYDAAKVPASVDGGATWCWHCRG